MLKQRLESQILKYEPNQLNLPRLSLRGKPAQAERKVR